MSKVVANRYGEALFRIGRDKQQLDLLADEARNLQRIFRENEQLIPFFEKPFISYNNKEALIDNVFQDFQKDTRHLLKLLAMRDRMALVPQIMERAIDLINDAEGRAEATVYSARTLSEAEEKSLESTLLQQMDKQALMFNTVIDSSLLGGVKVRVGNRIYDGTVTGKLQRIERQIKKAGA